MTYLDKLSAIESALNLSNPLKPSDQTRIDWGSPLGIQEVGATRSTLLDNARDITNLKAQIDSLNQQILALQEINKQQTLDVKTALNSGNNTGTSTTYHPAPGIPVEPPVLPVPPTPQPVSIFTEFFNWLSGK